MLSIETMTELHEINLELIRLLQIKEKLWQRQEDIVEMIIESNDPQTLSEAKKLKNYINDLNIAQSPIMFDMNSKMNKKIKKPDDCPFDI